MAFPLGQRVILKAEFRNDAGVLTNPGVVTLEVLTPQDEDLAPALVYTNPSAGKYEAALVLDLPGQWAWKWTGLGNGVDQAPEGTIEVLDSPFVTADSYDDEPGTNVADELRLRLGDTDRSSPLLTSAQLAWLLTKADNDVEAATLLGARLLAARFSRAYDVAEGDVRRSLSQQAKNYRDLVTTLEGSAGAVSAEPPIPQAGGLRRSEADTRDPDLVDSYFTLTNPGGWGPDERAWQ